MDQRAFEERVFRSRIADFLFGLTFPATREQIIRQARHNNTASQIVDALLDLPDRAYESMADVQATARYHPPHVWDIDGFPRNAIRHDQIEAERLRGNTARVERPAPPPPTQRP